MACNPPYCNGTGSYCGCNCNCCPPDGCCTKVTLTFECGTSYSIWEGGNPNEGCECNPEVYLGDLGMWAGLKLAEGHIGVPFPNFNSENEGDDEFVWSLQGCSIPCETVKVHVTTSGCCLQLSGDDNDWLKTIVAVGGGTVTAVFDDGSTQGTPYTPCGVQMTFVNGAQGSYVVANPGICEDIDVDISPGMACCVCCLVKTECANALFAPIIFRQKNIQAGTNKNYLNKKNLLERVRNLRRRK